MLLRVTTYIEAYNDYGNKKRKSTKCKHLKSDTKVQDIQEFLMGQTRKISTEKKKEKRKFALKEN